MARGADEEEAANMHGTKVAVALVVSALLLMSPSVSLGGFSGRGNGGIAASAGHDPIGASSAVAGADERNDRSDDEDAIANGAMPSNPSQPLPEQIDGSIPNSAQVVAGNLALLGDGTVKNLDTGRTVTDPVIVGTPSTPPDPLAKTNGKSFIPVSVGTVRSTIADASGAADGPARASVYSPSAKAYVRNAALNNSDWGAHWGTYNDSPAFFGASGDLFAQQAQGVIDVSEHNGNINWNQVKASGVQGAIIRISFAWGNRYDYQALRNIAECKRLGIPFGIYLYSYAYNAGTAASEGADIVSKLREANVQPSDLKYPVFYDLEAWAWEGHAHPTSPSVYEGMVNAWYGKLRGAGYTNLSVYSYMDYLQHELNSASIHAKTRWVARYGQEMHFDFSTNYRGWQYWDKGRVAGISGDVDLSAFGNQTYQTPINAAAYTSLSIPNGDYYINSFAKDSSSIDMPAASTSNGVRTQLYQANRSAAQRYHFTRQSNGSYVITNVNSRKALDVAGGVAGNLAAVRQWTANGTRAQQWYIRDSGAGYYLQSALGNWVLDLAGGSVSNGTSIRLYAPNGTSTQKFLVSSAVVNIPLGVAVSVTSSINSSLVLDLAGGSHNAGARFQLYPWNGTDAQLYNFQQVGNGVYRVLNRASGKVMEIAGGATANGGAVQQWTSNNTAAQHWSVLSYNGAAVFINNASGKAVDVPGADARQYKRLQSYTFNGSRAQCWIVAAQESRSQLNAFSASHRSDLRDGILSLHTRLRRSMALDVAGGSLSDGAQVRLWSSNGTRAQQWKVSHDSQGYVTFINVGSGKALDVMYGSMANGATIDQFAGNGTYAQKWVVVKGSDGTYTIYSGLRQSMVLDVAGASTAIGARVQLYGENSTTAQRWSLG